MSNQAIFMKGNLTEGYIPFGPYESRDEAADIHDCEDGWVMTLNDVRVSTDGEREEMHDHSLEEANSIPPPGESKVHTPFLGLPLLDHLRGMFSTDYAAFKKELDLYNKDVEGTDMEVSVNTAKDVYARNAVYAGMMPEGVKYITKEEDPDVVYNFNPYMTLDEYTQPPARAWNNHLGNTVGYFFYEGGWDIGLKDDGLFHLWIEDHYGDIIEFGSSHNLRELETKLHAYESLRAANRVW